MTSETWWVYPLLSFGCLVLVVALYEWDNKRLREENFRLKEERKKFYELFCKSYKKSPGAATPRAKQKFKFTLLQKIGLCNRFTRKGEIL